MTKRIIKDSKAKKSTIEPVCQEDSGQESEQRQTSAAAEPLSKRGRKINEPPNSVESHVPGWKTLTRLGGFALVVLLNIALIMSDVSYHRGVKAHPHQVREWFLYGALLFFNVTIMIPAVFEVRWLKANAEGLSLATIWWKAKLSWQDVLEFRRPKYLKVAWLRTARCFYILNKRDLGNYDLIEQTLLENIQ